MPTDPFMGWITPFGCSFTPRGWSSCAGQILPVASQTTLFSLLTTTYGGNGRSTFQLPDLRGRVVVGTDTAGSYPLAITGGVETVTLTESQIPSHTHSAKIPVSTTTIPSPTDRNTGYVQGAVNVDLFGSTSGTGLMKGSHLSSSGGGHDHTNQQPYQVLNYCIAVQGQYPSRS